jgi:dynactin complex subunit
VTGDESQQHKLKEKSPKCVRKIKNMDFKTWQHQRSFRQKK